MKTTCYLVINDRGNGLKFTKNKPSTQHNEVAIQLHIELPDSLFQRPQIVASVTSTEDFPIEISAETKDNVREAIEETTGQRVQIEVVHHEQEDRE